ncbi:MAG: hypothetical protein ACM31D_20290 [Bacteroidota bacterium]
MKSAFADSVGQFTKPSAPAVPKVKSVLATNFPDALKVETINADKPPIVGSDYGMYANVVVNGKVVASVSNSGCSAVADGYYDTGMGDAFEGLGYGPQAAQERAEIIARALGGTVEKLSTAQTPEQWAKSGKTYGMIDLWGIGDDGLPCDHHQVPQQVMDVLLRQQETPRSDT